MRLFLGIPSAGAPATPFTDSLSHLDIPTAISSIDRAVITGNYVPAQRDLILERALEARADALFMCDDDMVLPKNALAQLLQTLQADDRIALAGALYYSRDGFRPMAIDAWDPHDTRTAVIPAFDVAPVDVAGVGFGCVVLRMSAIADLEPPYFAANVFVERRAGNVRVCNEDYLFCKRLRDSGHRVQLDPSVRCGHYDRASKRVMPQAWEPSALTNRVRMAALVEGNPRLVDANPESASAAETHVPAALDYIIVP